MDPNLSLALVNLARFYADHGGPLADARQFAQKAKGAQPDDPAVNDTLGWVYCKLGQYASALSPLEAAVAKNPQEGKFQYHLGLAYLGAGQTMRARTVLHAALNLGLSPDEVQSAQAALQKAGS